MPVSFSKVQAWQRFGKTGWITGQHVDTYTGFSVRPVSGATTVVLEAMSVFATQSSGWQTTSLETTVENDDHTSGVFRVGAVIQLARIDVS